MKALTLWQPWASLVAEGHKAIETRSWSTRYRGPLAIHAAKAPGGYIEIPYGGNLNPERKTPLWATYRNARALPRGEVVAIAELIDVVPIGRSEGGFLVTLDGSEWPEGYLPGPELAHGDFTEGRYAWLLANVTPLADPIPAKGRQGLWEWTWTGLFIFDEAREIPPEAWERAAEVLANRTKS